MKIDTRTLTVIDAPAADAAGEGRAHRYVASANFLGTANPPLVQCWDNDPEKAKRSIDEVTKRHNAFLDLVSHLDGMLVPYEDASAIPQEIVKDARKFLNGLGFTERVLGKLADINEATEQKN